MSALIIILPLVNIRFISVKSSNQSLVSSLILKSYCPNNPATINKLSREKPHKNSNVKRAQTILLTLRSEIDVHICFALILQIPFFPPLPP